MTAAERAQQLREGADFSEGVARGQSEIIDADMRHLAGDRALEKVSTSPRSTPEWRAFLAAQVAYREAQLLENLARKNRAQALATMQRAEAALSEADGKKWAAEKPIEDEG